MSDDKVFLITGASTGIGAETAKLAAKDGYRVVLAARSEDKLSKLAGEIDGETLVVPTDVTEWPQVEHLAKQALDAYGRIDVVFANAGFGGARGFEPDDPEAEWREMILTNVYGCALTIRATVAALKESKGHILLTGSVAGRRALPSVYSATKWAVTGMGEGLRQYLNDTGVRTTLIEPGMTDTPFFDNKPTIHALEPEDIARAVMYAVAQPPHVDVNEVLIRPTAQPM